MQVSCFAVSSGPTRECNGLAVFRFVSPPIYIYICIQGSKHLYLSFARLISKKETLCNKYKHADQEHMELYGLLSSGQYEKLLSGQKHPYSEDMHSN
jgi:hypothetical protein